MNFNTNKISKLPQRKQAVISDYQKVSDYATDDDNLLEMDLIQRANPEIDFAFYSVLWSYLKIALYTSNFYVLPK